ncbi:MAG TPA: hypothetical protein VF498_04640 [Anaerolineales bacterium]
MPKTNQDDESARLERTKKKGTPGLAERVRRGGEAIEEFLRELADTLHPQQRALAPIPVRRPVGRR